MVKNWCGVVADEVKVAGVSADEEQQRRRVAAIIPAKDEADRVGLTARAARAIPNVDLVIVVDDGSTDDTQHVARLAGATAVRHTVNRGKASAMETGAGVAAMHDVPGQPPRLLLFLDADLGETAVETAVLIDPVLSGEVDCSIAMLPPQPGAGGRGLVTGLARKHIQKMTGWSPVQPLSGQRCMTRAAFEAASPLAAGWGVETAMTIDLLTQGFSVQEIPCNLQHRPSGKDLRGQIHRAKQYRGVWLAIMHRRLRRIGLSPERYRQAAAAQEPGSIYRAFEV